MIKQCNIKNVCTKIASAICTLIIIFNLECSYIHAQNEALSTASVIQVSAGSAILIEANSGRILYSKQEHIKRPMASTTKIMTALVALEESNLSKTVKVSDKSVGIEGSSIYLYKGEELTMEQLLYALMLQSANDAASAIAIDISGSIEDFALKMNDKAKKLGLSNTSFQNPHGLDSEEHYTTAYDLSQITRYALENDNFKKIVSTQRKAIPMQNGAGTRLLINHNRLLQTYDGMIGVKTGYTKRSGRCLVTAAERDGLKLIAVTLNAPDDWNDHKRMLDYGFSKLDSVSLLDTPITGEIPTVGATVESVKYKSGDKLSAVLPKGDREIKMVIEMSLFYYAPISEGDVLGRVVFYDGNNEIASTPIVAAQNIQKRKEKLNFFARLISIFKR